MPPSRTWALVLASLAAVALAACGGDDETDTEPDDGPPPRAAVAASRIAEEYCGGVGRIRDLARTVRSESLEPTAIARSYAANLAANRDFGLPAAQAESAIYDGCLAGLVVKLDADPIAP